jgi:hypothetical protein
MDEGRRATRIGDVAGIFKFFVNKNGESTKLEERENMGLTLDI